MVNFHSLSEQKNGHEANVLSKAYLLGYEHGCVDALTKIPRYFGAVNRGIYPAGALDSGKTGSLANSKKTLVHASSNLSLEREGRFMDELVGSYELVGGTEVIEFIALNPYLKEFLLETADEIRKIFGEGTKLVLNKMTDPEFSGDIKLFALIYTDLPFETTMDRFKQFYTGWYIHNMKRAQGRFNFDVRWF